MKRTLILPATIAAITLASCSTYSYMTTEIYPDLSAGRKVYANADSAFLSGNGTASPFFFRTDTAWRVSPAEPSFEMDFYDSRETMNVYAERRFTNLSGSGFIPKDGKDSGNPVLNPRESAEKHFRWFYTLYEYSATYSKIDSLPIPLDDALSQEQQEFFFRGKGIPKGWNGIELYYALNDINTLFNQWYRKSTMKVSYDILYSLSDSLMRTSMAEVSEKIANDMLSNGKEEDITPGRLGHSLDTLLNTGYFSRLYRDNAPDADAKYKEKEDIIRYFSVSILSELKLPGKIIKTDAPVIKDGKPQWKIDSYRLLYGDLTLNAVSRKANIWAFIATFILVAAAVFLAWTCLSRRKG